MPELTVSWPLPGESLRNNPPALRKSVHPTSNTMLWLSRVLVSMSLLPRLGIRRLISVLPNAGSLQAGPSRLLRSIAAPDFPLPISSLSRRLLSSSSQAFSPKRSHAARVQKNGGPPTNKKLKTRAAVAERFRRKTSGVSDLVYVGSIADA